MTSDKLGVADVPGAAAFLDWFGGWPSFHDAEVLSIELRRMAPARIAVHVFETSREVDENGFFRRKKDAVVTFVLHKLVQLELNGFNEQNVLSGAFLRRVPAGYQLTLGGLYGVDGQVTAEEVQLEFVSGKPATR